MEQENLIVQLKPSYRASANDRGYNLEEGDYNDYDILFNQGFNTDEVEIEPGEEFTISRDFESGSINCEETKYTYVKIKTDNWDDDDRYDEDWIVLRPGKYRFEDDGITITQLSDVAEDEDSDW